MNAPATRAQPRPHAQDGIVLSRRSFDVVCAMFHSVSGIHLGPGKQALVAGRLHTLARERGFADIDSYIDTVLQGGDDAERVRVVDRLTTNETYFFRESAHFDELARLALAHRAGTGEPFRVWSAASSSGEEAYSIAMVLSDKLGPSGWEVVGTDLSTAMVDACVQGLYPQERTRDVPPAYLRRYCRRGTGRYDGWVLMGPELRQNLRFGQGNLMQPLPPVGHFDVIFLRNVLIYFDMPTKQAVVRRVIRQLKPHGRLFTGHSESMNNMGLPLRPLQSAVYALIE